MALVVKRYAAELSDDWLRVLDGSRNGVFLFDRSFIEYHGDRFTDCSAVAYLDGEPVALLPASTDMASGAVSSHAGLTFGGFVMLRELRSAIALEVIDAMLVSLKDWGAKTLIVKMLPQVFCSYPSAEVDYGLSRRGFSITRRDLSSILPLVGSLSYNKSKAQAIKKAKKEGLVCSAESPARFHALLEEVLRAQHEAAPVHSLPELELLLSRFPDNMFLHAATRDGELLAGTLIFKYGHIWHTQYMAASEAGRGIGALDMVIDEVIHQARVEGVDYLSFGASTEVVGTLLNEGLLWQKESYGARSITHDFMAGVL